MLYKTKQASRSETLGTWSNFTDIGWGATTKEKDLLRRITDNRTKLSE